MDEELIVDKNYQKGFNHGYILAQHEPDLAAKVAKSPNPNNEYFKGLVSGKQEYDMEKTRTRLKGVSKNNTPDKDINKDKGKKK